MSETEPPIRPRRVASGHGGAYRTPSIQETRTIGARVDGELRCLEHYVVGRDGEPLTVGDLRELIRNGRLQWITDPGSLTGETACVVCGTDLREAH